MQQVRQNQVRGNEVSRRDGGAGFHLFVQQDVRAGSREQSEKTEGRHSEERCRIETYTKELNPNRSESL